MNLYVLKTWMDAKFRRGEEGANLVQSILLVAFIALLVILAVLFLRSAIEDEFRDAGNCLNEASVTTTSC